jgi:hypothetical protein
VCIGWYLPFFLLAIDLYLSLFIVALWGRERLGKGPHPAPHFLFSLPHRGPELLNMFRSPGQVAHNPVYLVNSHFPYFFPGACQSPGALKWRGWLFTVKWVLGQWKRQETDFCIFYKKEISGLPMKVSLTFIWIRM